MLSLCCLSYFPIVLQVKCSAETMHFRTLSMTHQFSQSFLLTGVQRVRQNWIHAGFACFSFVLGGCARMRGASKMISCFRLASVPHSQPWLCLLRDCRKSQCNIHSVCLGKPISYFSLDKSGLERLSQSLFFSDSLSAAPLYVLSLTLSTTALLSLPSK